MLARQTALRALGRRYFTIAQRFDVPEWATVDPWEMTPENPAIGRELCGGEWLEYSKTRTICDPLNGKDMVVLPDRSIPDTQCFIDRMKNCPRSGRHNPIKNPQRYVELGKVTGRAANEMYKPEVEDFFAQLIQRVAPKHEVQCRGEVNIVRAWLQYMSGDTVRNLARSFALPGDRPGMSSQGYRWPFGGVGVVTPFNFPIEICGIQTLSAVLMGNQPLCKPCEKVSIAMEQLIRMLHHCGLEKDAIDYAHCRGPVVEHILVNGEAKTTVFTGSQKIAEQLCSSLHGKVKLEDAGFDWKVLGPDVGNMEYVAWQSDLDSYGYSGQKCSAQSMLFAHENWVKAGIFEKLEKMAARRNLADFSIGPILTESTESMLAHADKLASIPGAKILFGAKELENHTIPKQYGAIHPTAVYVPIEKILDNFEDVVREIFGPFQVVTEYKADQEDLVLEILNTLKQHLTAGIVSQDHAFIEKFLGNTFVGTTYAGMRARTTAAPQQMWFGPCGDPRGAGIHTPEAIQLCWSGHREVIYDFGAIEKDFVATNCV